MMHKHCFKALDNSIRDILRHQNDDRLDIPFGGKVVVLGGDSDKFFQLYRKEPDKKLYMKPLILHIFGNFARY